FRRFPLSQRSQIGPGRSRAGVPNDRRGLAAHGARSCRLCRSLQPPTEPSLEPPIRCVFSSMLIRPALEHEKPVSTGNRGFNFLVQQHFPLRRIVASSRSRVGTVLLPPRSALARSSRGKRG